MGPVLGSLSKNQTLGSEPISVFPYPNLSFEQTDTLELQDWDCMALLRR